MPLQRVIAEKQCGGSQCKAIGQMCTLKRYGGHSRKSWQRNCAWFACFASAIRVHWFFLYTLSDLYLLLEQTIGPHISSSYFVSLSSAYSSG
ncbi:hypothetical protein TSUD_386130 [Trifolium subterraneum]|uniref:Uncharacterized protein n=1 Tax=Trifolium subterraneum TaxID=3900 RepID=A0A2Z6LVH8_TRISU|nr:hypothetical protein TSUD_386130 [Trifolium subterraneum]